jgi:hypothetical protein
MEYYASGEPATDGNQGLFDNLRDGFLGLDNSTSASLFL